MKVEQTSEDMELLVNLMVEGWGRVSKITDDRSARFEQLPANTRRFLVRTRGSENSRAFTVAEAVETLTESFRRLPTLMMFRPDVINEFGNTANNLREFEFFRSFQKLNGLDLPSVNVGDQIDLRKTTAAVNVDDADVFREAFTDWMAARGRLAPYTMHALVMYTQTLLSWVNSNPQCICDRVPFVVVSNDHAPVPVALVQAARYRGIPSVYLQHAEVTDHFPPLLFDVSVLHNERSVDVYREVGPLHGSTYVVPRSAEPISIDRLRRPLEGKIDVGLYLTEQVEMNTIGEVVRELQSNSKIQSLVICPHPRSSELALEKLASLGSLSTSSAANPDVAVVQNSSVVTELLHRGIRVFHLPGYDWLPADYYGFVADGVCSEVNLDALRGDFWQRFEFGDTWQTAYGRINPAANPEEAGTQSAALVSHLKQLWRERTAGAAVDPEQSDPGSWTQVADREAVGVERWASSALLEAPVSFFSGGFLTELSVDHELGLLQEVERSHGERNPKLVKVFYTALQFDSVNVFHAVLKLKAIGWTYIELTSEMFEEILSVHAGCDESQALTRKLEGELVVALLRSGRLDWIKRFFRSARLLSLQSFGVDKRAVLSELTAELPVTDPFRQGIESGLKVGLTSYERLKLRTLSAATAKSDRLDHSMLVEEFCHRSPDSVRDDFIGQVKPIYERLYPLMEYMDIRWDESQRDDLKRLVKERLNEKQPFSMVRLSDGEGYLFQDMSRRFSAEDASNREKHWWGHEIDAEIREKIISQSLSSVATADVVGIPSMYRFIKDCSERTVKLDAGLTTRGLLSVLEGIDQLPLTGKKLTEEKANIPLFSDVEELRGVVDSAEKVVFVTSVRAEELCKRLDRDVDVIPIPTHFRTHDNGSYLQSSQSLPELIDTIADQVRLKSAPGVLVLVSAGIAGKVLFGIARAKGAVALDIGGAVDQWLKADHLVF